MNKAILIISVLAIIVGMFDLGAYIGVHNYKSTCEHLGWNNTDQWLECPL